MTKAGYINIVCTPLSAGVGKREGGGWGVNLLPNFEKRICNFYIKDKLKSEIFNDKKSL